jgi:hypothetical protein
VLGPDGAAVPIRREKAPTPSQDAVTAQVFQPGLYRVQVQPAVGAVREEPSLGFVARLDPKESDLRRVDEAELKAQLGGAGSAQVASTAQAAEGARGTPLWGTLLLLGVLAVLGEGALTRR